MHQLGVRERQRAARVHQQVAVRRRDEGDAALQGVALVRLPDAEGGALAEDLGQQAAVARIHVLHHHQRGRKIGGQGAKHLAQCLEAAGGRGERDERKPCHS
jgi:hypothetical protein